MRSLDQELPLQRAWAAPEGAVAPRRDVAHGAVAAALDEMEGDPDAGGSWPGSTGTGRRMVEDSRGSAGLNQGCNLRAGGGVASGFWRRVAGVAGPGKVQRGRAAEHRRIPPDSAGVGGATAGLAAQAERFGRAKDQSACQAPAAPRPPGSHHQRTAGRRSDRAQVPKAAEADDRLRGRAARAIAGQDRSGARPP